ncbi:MAG: DUF1217 domain-containing protein [Rhizobiaceae bacterium]
MLSTYLSYQMIARDLPKALDRVEKQPTVSRDTAYYLENIGKVKSIEDFVDDDRLFRYAMKAHGLEDMAYARAFMVKVLEEGVTDPDSFANRLSDKRYADFAKTYNFDKYGELATTYNKAQHDVPANFATQVQLGALSAGFAAHAAETGYYISNITNATTVDGLMADQRLLDYALKSFGLDPATETPERIREMLEGGVADPDSPANQLADKRYANFVTAFDFVAHGADTTLRPEVVGGVPKKYAASTGQVLVRMDAAYIAAEAEYYSANIGDVASIEDLLADKRLLTIAMAAHGLDASAETERTIREMLTGGVTDPAAPANQPLNHRFRNFVAAFDFQQHGATTTSRDVVQLETLALYVGKATVGYIAPTADYIEAETDHYLSNVSKLTSIDDLMGDKRLLAYALSAYGLDPAVETPERVRQMLAGGVADPQSPANKLTDKSYAAFVTAFNFAEFGTEATTYVTAREASTDKFVRQTLEENAGAQNEGVRLALYFERKAESLTNWYAVLADPALAQVVRTILGLPDSFASADIDRQAKLFEQKLDIEDLQDPEALGKLMRRFTSMWEIANPTQSSQPNVAILFGQPAEFGISTNLLMTLQGMKF